MTYLLFYPIKIACFFVRSFFVVVLIFIYLFFFLYFTSHVIEYVKGLASLFVSSADTCFCRHSDVKILSYLC